MTKKERASAIIDLLKIKYPQAFCSLEYENPLQLLISVRLAAQCTDARVNMITPALFKKFPDIDAFCEASPEEIEPYIHSCGFFRQKAKDIVGMCRIIRAEYDGRVPDTIEELTRLPGVGRKTANLIVGDVYGKPSIVCDTHCIRISGRLGLTDGTKDPLKTEMQLKKILPSKESGDLCHRFVLFGRETCSARSPKCDICELYSVCKNRRGESKNFGA